MSASNGAITDPEGCRFRSLASFSHYGYGRAHAAWMMTGFPRYCTGSLMMITSSICSRIGLRRFFASSPTSSAESSSLTLRSSIFLSLPSNLAVGKRRLCESDSLRRERGEVGAKHLLGLPASLGKQKRLPVTAAFNPKLQQLQNDSF